MRQSEKPTTMTTAVKKNQDVEERERLISQLLDAVKQCQIRFGGKKELATEIDKRVNVLCGAWENVFHHGLKCNTNSRAIATLKQLTQVTGLNKISSKINGTDDLRNLETEPVFWSCVKEHLSRHELQRYMNLKNVSTDNGRGLAWLRSALNEHSLEKYIQMMISSPELLSQFYEDWALLRDEEKSSLLPNMAAGLGSILFAISIDNPSLNVERPSTGSSFFFSRVAVTHPLPLDDDVSLQPAVVKNVSQGEGKREKKRKKKPAKIVTFDNEDFSSCSASPASCLVSPQERTASGMANSRHVVSINKDSVHLPSKLAVLSREPGSNESFSKSNVVSTLTETEIRTEPPQRFSFDGFELQNSANGRAHNPEQETGYDSSGLCSLNGFLSDSSGHKEQFVIEVERSAMLGNSENDGETKNRSPSSLDRFSVAQTSDLNLQKNISCNVGTAVVNSALNPKSMKGLSLPHSDSVTSTTSMASTCSQSSNFMTCDIDSKISLVPLNAEGKPVELDDITAGSFDGDTSESYGSYDSHEMPYGDMVHRATHAVGEAERALNDSLSRYANSHNNCSVPDNINALSDALSYEDLKQALIAMMVRKDEAEELNRRLQVALEAERQSVSSLRREIEDKHQAELLRQEKNAEKNRALVRENELLKNQLKKYVGAVQMLRQGGTVEDLPGISVDSPQPVIPPQRSSIDYSFEAAEYEKKLIQVAEMHGELMEFNELLQRQLIIREAQLKRVTNELVNLRGPLPVEIGPNESEVNATTSGVNPALINIWIPSAFLKGTSSDAFHVYQVYVHIRNEEWNIYRRYAEFYELHCKLKKKYPAIGLFDFPPKKAFGKKDPKIVEVRRKKLETYLRQVIHHLTEKSRKLAESPSRQVLTAILPFFSDEGKAERTTTTRPRPRRSHDRSSRSATLHSSASSDALNRSGDEHPQQYMGL